MNLFVILNLLAYFAFETIDGANILGVFPSPSFSHQIVFRPLMKALAERGHSILVVTTEPIQLQSNLTLKYEQIDIHDVSYEVLSLFFSKIIIEEVSTSAIIKHFENLVIDLIDAQLSSPQLQKLIKNDTRSFDLCFIENWEPAMFAFKDRFNCSMIIISSMIGSLANHDAFRNPTNPILYPDNNAPFVSDLNFWQRLYVTYLDVYWRFSYYLQFLPKNDDLVEKYFGKGMRSVNVIENEADMLFLNGHPLISGVRPVVPSIIYMNSLHINPPKSLPKELEAILNASTNGVIYLSFGTNVQSSKLPSKKLEAFLNAFTELSYTVIWKFDGILLKKPKNVYFTKWVPQQDLLAHPKTKLFIMQAGLQSLEEAIHFHVPMIGIPFFGDQLRNSHVITKYNLGIELNHHMLTKDMIKRAITTILNNSSYRQNVERLSALIKDEPQKPLERAVWWTEYILRHRGARHLRSKANKYTFYQYFLLDIVAFCLLVVYITVFLLKLAYGKLFSNVKNKIKSS